MRHRLSVAEAVLIPFCLLYFASIDLAVSQANPEPARGINWQSGPFEADLGGVAKIRVPKGVRFADGDGARRFLELNQDPPSGNEVGVLIPEHIRGHNDGDWIMLFDFDEVGYISDSEKGTLDAEGLLESIRRGTEAANERRKERGWSPFHVSGWSQRPFFDDKTKNLTWAIVGQDEKAKPGDETVNYSVRVLGRRGTMNVDLVSDPQHLQFVLPQFTSIMSGFSYDSGSRYAEFIKGDKVAGYGLTALIAGERLRLR